MSTTPGSGILARWAPALLIFALGVNALYAGDAIGAAGWFFTFGLWVFGQFSRGAAKPPSRLIAYAINWLAPALMLAGCVHRITSRDYWGVAFFLVGLGFTLVNAIYLEPSPRRTRLYRTLIGLLSVVSAAAIWKTVWP